ncbi:hypothetical protein DBIPINDM_006338 [Mesorhizobium sp. AR02]|uniref:hypothetical protein n=1 Tax=Mesorhizobium sp. AR02 TaxID=2865837 RepID=UPI002160C197|nr:hypothetical protein [Mesorhizobium sp. AR02]UVK52898.1 hypothetical protein DBIPINDM_006338 [Mesorhizobium sp. AR02]
MPMFEWPQALASYLRVNAGPAWLSMESGFEDAKDVAPEAEIGRSPGEVCFHGTVGRCGLRFRPIELDCGNYGIVRIGKI